MAVTFCRRTLAAGTYSDGKIAAIEHPFGMGRALLIGTFPGAGYYLHHSPAEKAFFAGLLDWAKVAPQVRTGATGVQARLHTGPGGTYLYVVNPDRKSREIPVTLPGMFTSGTDLWAGSPVTVRGNAVQVTVGDRDVAVIRLK